MDNRNPKEESWTEALQGGNETARRKIEVLEGIRYRT